MKRHFYLHILNGKLIDNKRVISNYLHNRKNGECKITISTGVDVEDNKRSSKQNRYYWGVVVKTYLDCMLDTGDNAIEKVREELHLSTLLDALHEVLLYRFAGCELLDHDTGEIMNIPMRTSEMNTKQISLYWDKIRADCKDKYGEEIPPPPSDLFKGLNQN